MSPTFYGFVSGPSDYTEQQTTNLKVLLCETEYSQQSMLWMFRQISNSLQSDNLAAGTMPNDARTDFAVW